MPVTTRAQGQRGDGYIGLCGVDNLTMQQPSAVQQADKYQAPEPLNPIREEFESEGIGAQGASSRPISDLMAGIGETGGMYGDHAVQNFESRYTMPSFDYTEDFDAQDEGWDDFGVHLGREISYEELCPKGQRVTMDSLAKLIWNTKVDIRKDMLSMHDSVCKIQHNTVTRIKQVESNQQVMCEVMKQMEISQTVCSDVSTNNTQGIDNLTKEFGKMVASINGLRHQVGRLTVDTNQHQRNFNDFNLRIHNMKSPIQARATGPGREDTVDLVADLFLTNQFISNISKDELKSKIMAAFRVGVPRIAKPRCTLVKFNCIRTRNIIFYNAMAKQKELRKTLRAQKKKPDKDSIGITEDMTPLDMREKDQLQPLIDTFTKDKKPAYYTKGKVVVTNQGRVKQELINEFLTKSQLKPIHVQPDFRLTTLERSRNFSAPSGPVNNIGQRGDYIETYNSYAPLFSDYFMENKEQGKSRTIGRGRARQRDRGQSDPGFRDPRW